MAEKKVEVSSMCRNRPRKEYYMGPNGVYRISYLFCGDCTYKTTGHAPLVGHIDKYHPSSTTAHLSQPTSSQSTKKPTFESVKSRYKTIKVIIVTYLKKLTFK